MGDPLYRNKILARANAQESLAVACEQRAERIVADLRDANHLRDALEDDFDGSIWIGRAADALRQAAQSLRGRARRNRDAVRSLA